MQRSIICPFIDPSIHPVHDITPSPRPNPSFHNIPPRIPLQHVSLQTYPSQLPTNQPAHPIFHECFTPPTTAPLTCTQSILSSNSSSTNPTTTTLSPRTRYRPCGTSLEGSGSSGGRMMRSIVCESTCLLSVFARESKSKPDSVAWYEESTWKVRKVRRFR